MDHLALAVSDQGRSRSFYETYLGFEAEPYSTSIRERAIGQHDELVRAIVERRPQAAADLAGEHFSLTEDAIRKLLGRVRT